MVDLKELKDVQLVEVVVDLDFLKVVVEVYDHYRYVLVEVVVEVHDDLIHFISKMSSIVMFFYLLEGGGGGGGGVFFVEVVRPRLGGGGGGAVPVVRLVGADVPLCCCRNS